MVLLALVFFLGRGFGSGVLWPLVGSGWGLHVAESLQTPASGFLRPQVCSQIHVQRCTGSQHPGFGIRRCTSSQFMLHELPLSLRGFCGGPIARLLGFRGGWLLLVVPPPFGPPASCSFWGGALGPACCGPCLAGGGLHVAESLQTPASGFLRPQDCTTTGRPSRS